MVAHYREESCKTVEAAFCDTLKQRHVEQEQEQTFWDIEMVREWVDTADSLAPRPACPDKTVDVGVSRQLRPKLYNGSIRSKR